MTERMFAARYHDFWRELLPMLTPSLVSVLNSGHEEHLLDANGAALDVVDSQPGTRDAAIVSEYAFHLVRIALGSNRAVFDAVEDAAIRKQAETLAIRVVNSYEGAHVLPDNQLNDSEIHEGTELALRYPAFISALRGAGSVSFSLAIPGAGRLESCAADMAVDTSLVEIKTVKRPLASKDLRQLIVYLALNHAAKRYRWTHAGFFNPRRSTFHRWPIPSLVEELSGGRAAVDVFNDLVDYVCASDIQLDSVF
jgi:hypothetical protein